ncbi:MAG: chemotaxis protein CheX [Polyangiales bacterium]
MSPNDEVIEACVNEACLGLFTDYSLPLVRIQGEALQQMEPLLYCGVVGFSGDQLRGAVLLATSREPLGRTSPSSDSSLREWIAELANQLLGRIKNRLLPRGVTIHLSTPIVLRGAHIAPVSRSELVPYAFSCDGGNVCVWFDSEIAPGVDLTQVVDTEGLAAEGTSTLF